LKYDAKITNGKCGAISQAMDRVVKKHRSGIKRIHVGMGYGTAAHASAHLSGAFAELLNWNWRKK
jgi:hypothetical protein